MQHLANAQKGYHFGNDSMSTRFISLTVSMTTWTLPFSVYEKGCDVGRSLCSRSLNRLDLQKLVITSQ